MGCSAITSTATRDRWLAASEATRPPRVVCAAAAGVAVVAPGSSTPKRSARSSRRASAPIGARCACSFPVAGTARRTGVSCAAPALPSAGARTSARHAALRVVPRRALCCTSTASSCPSSLCPVTLRPWDRSTRPRTRAAGKTVVIGARPLRAALERERSSHPAPRGRLVSRAGVRTRPGGDVRQGRVLRNQLAFRDALAQLGARPILIPPFTPRWNGKVERFFGTLDSEWAHARVWPNSTTRDRALSSFLRFYNRRRPHSAAGGRPPISRVQQVREQDT